MKRSLYAGERIEHAAIYLFLVLLAALFLVPFFWMITGALKTEIEFGSMTVRLLPAEPQWDNFVEVFRRSNVPRGFLNSFKMAFIYTVPVLISSSMGGYAFARMRVKEKNTLFGVLLATMMLPRIATLIPSYMLFSTLNLTDTFWPWFLWGVGTAAVLVFLFRQFFSTLPKNLEEAALIDGCSRFGTFFRIIAPISTSAFVLGTIFSFNWIWSDFLTPFIYLTTRRLPMAVIIQTGLNPPFSPISQGDVPVKLAATTFFILPMIVLFFILQKNIVKGITTTGMKG